MLTLLMTIFLGVNWQVLTGQVSAQWDAGDFFAPYYTYLARLTRAGHFMLWNPFSSGGSPDFIEPQVGAFSPLTLLFGLIAGPGPMAFQIYWLCLWLLGGLGMYILARALAAPPWGALVTSLSFVFSGYYLGHAEHTSVVYTYSCVPWLLWRVRAALTSGRVWPAVEGGAIWGLSALAGNPAVVIPAALFTGAVALAWLPARLEASWSVRWRHYAVTMGLVAFVGVLILAPCYLGFRHEVPGYSHRSEPLARELVLNQGLGFRWLTTFASPTNAVAAGQLPGWSTFDLSLLPVYCGSLLPVLAIFALWQRCARRDVWVIAGTGLLALGVAMGSTLPLRGWLYDAVPLTRFFRHAPMFRGFFILAVAMLAAHGTCVLDESFRRGTPALAARLRSLAWTAGVCALLALAATAWTLSAVPNVLSTPFVEDAVFHTALVWPALAILCAAAFWRADFRRRLPVALVILTVADLSEAYFISHKVTYEETAVKSFLAPTLPLNNLGAKGFFRLPTANENDHLYVQQPVFKNYTAMLNANYTAWTLDLTLLPSVCGQRLWFADRPPVVPPTREAFAVFQRRVDATGRLILVRHERASLLGPSAVSAPLSAAATDAINHAPPVERVTYQVRRYRPNELVLNVDCPRAGFLLVTDRWSRSWEATVNGQSVPVEGGDFLFRLVPVHAGANVVAMRYQVFWIYWLVALSWSTLAVVGLATLWKWRPLLKVARLTPLGIRPALAGLRTGAPAT